MNTNENIRINLQEQEEIIELGVASVETKGGVFDPGEPMGLNIGTGISEEGATEARRKARLSF